MAIPKSKSRKRKVSVWVPWGNDQIECKVPQEIWDRVVAGKKDFHSFRTSFENLRTDVYFRFNDKGYGSLYAYYGDDGGEIYIGDLDDASIYIDGDEVPWSQLKRAKRLRSTSKTPAASEPSPKSIKRVRKDTRGFSGGRNS